MCGIVGIFSEHRVAGALYESLINLQHRGQDAAGIVTCQKRLEITQGLGLIREIFDKDKLVAMEGNIGIGHTRYPTAGGYSLSDVQPIWMREPLGIALAHNGNLVNYKALYQQLKHKNLVSSTDSELLLHLLSDGLCEGSLSFEKICQAVGTIYEKAQGSYSVVSVIAGHGLLAFRDPHGIKPLVMGKKNNDIIFASETTMFYPLGFESLGDVQPGEVVFVDLQGNCFRKILAHKPFRPCIFEYVYLAKPNATLDGVSVYASRVRMGQSLAKSWQIKFQDIKPDVVIPVPYTSNTAALSFAEALGVRYCEGLHNNTFIGRTFIMPDGEDRGKNIRRKLTPHRVEIKDKSVLVLDDSIVRGTTSRNIVKMLREHGAKEVSFASACAPIIEPCFYGIDIPVRSELLAAEKTEEEIRQYLGVDRLIYQDREKLAEAILGDSASPIKRFCMACMDGDYITGGMTQQKKTALEIERHTLLEAQ